MSTALAASITIVFGQDRFPLPTNCVLEAMGPNSEPWALGLPQVGTYYLPIVMQSWSHHGGQSRGPYFKSHGSPQHNSSVRIGLVWSAGRHKAPNQNVVLEFVMFLPICFLISHSVGRKLLCIFGELAD